MSLHLQQVDWFSPFAAHARKLRRTAAGLDVNLGSKNTATFLVRYPGGREEKLSGYSDEAGRKVCAEQALMEEFENDPQYKGAVIDWVFTDREPCGPLLHNCRSTLDAFLQKYGTYHNKVYYVMPFGDDIGKQGKSKSNKAVRKYADGIYNRFNPASYR